MVEHDARIHRDVKHEGQGTMERMYGLTGKTPAKPLAGQAKEVFDAMGGATGEAPEFKTAKSWTDLVVARGNLVTRQDAYRVVLYYILIFKKRELVKVQDAPVFAVPAASTVERPGLEIDANEPIGTITADELRAIAGELDPDGENDGDPDDEDPDAEGSEERDPEEVGV